MRWWPYVLMLSVGCGASASTSKVPSPFTEEDAEIFDNAVDFIESPDMLRGDWGNDLLYRLQRRVDRSDLIAVIRVPVLNTNTNLDRERAYHLDVAVEKRLRGNPPDHLALRVGEEERGFGSIRSAEERILSERFLVFLKWTWDPVEEQRTARWHLSLASEAMQTTVSSMLGRGASQRQEPKPATELGR